MTTLNTAASIDLVDLSTAEPSPAAESLWSRILELAGTIIGKSWSYLNEDMGPVNTGEDCPYFGDCCM